MADENEISLSEEIGAALDSVAQTDDLGTADAVDAPIEASEGRARDEQGRFAAKEAAPQTENGQQAAPQTPSADQTQTPQVPVSWTKEEQAQFLTLPPALQGTILRRDQERDRAFGQAMQNIAGVEKFHAALRPTLDQYRPLIEATGAPPEQIIGELFALYAFSQNDPKGYLAWVTENLGVAPETAPAADEYADPAFTELRQGYQRLNETVQQMNARIQKEDAERKQQAQQAEQEKIRNSITQWSNQKNPDGSAKWPHFGERQVQKYMGKLMEIDDKLTLDTAYEQATRALGLQAPTVQPEKKPLHNLNSRGAGNTAKAAPGSLRDTIAEALDSVH
jgi:hypothetical protein